jgi:predicted alpha/beta superfamily hydrolase
MYGTLAAMPRTVIDVVYPSDFGVIGLRGDTPPLSWETSVLPTTIVREPTGDRHRFELDFPAGRLIEWKPIRDEKLWSSERNYAMLAGESLTVAPYFHHAKGLLKSGEPPIASPELGFDVQFRVFLPPSYEEQRGKRYPVLYAQDGQALFSAAPDPGDPHSWRMDDALNQLYEYGVIEEIIVVAVTTKERRIEMLSPTADPAYGGGRADAYLDFLVRTLKPHVDATWRTRSEAESTALIGASMGGLFAFYGAWTRGDTFGRAACLSASFWWDQRSMLRLAQQVCPAPRPWLYIDSGTALSQFEQDANVRDGFDHTQAVVTALRSSCYGQSATLVSLAYAGFQHDASAWAARLAIPLQLLFPRRG